jgi:transposase InsO family protein
MPWEECTVESGRREFVLLARQEGSNVSDLCRRFGISRKTGYKWLGRGQEGGDQAFADRPRRPHRSPRQSPAQLEAVVCAARAEHPAWGGRKLHHWLKARGQEPVPAPSTITRILDRNGLLSAERRLERDWQRFEEDEPNALWQMDYKHVALGHGQARCHALTVLDDCSRYSVCLKACADERSETVREQLTRTFQRYGLPQRMLMDNGAPWGSDLEHRHTHLTAWLIRLGVRICHGRPYHPQTQGKDERFHRSLDLEVLRQKPRWRDLADVQAAFDRWRVLYNEERPHEALDNRPPSHRYRPSSRMMPAQLPPIDYGAGATVRKVQDKGRINFRGKEHLISRAFIGEPVALFETGDGCWDVYYCDERVARIDLACSQASVHPSGV